MRRRHKKSPSASVPSGQNNVHSFVAYLYTQFAIQGALINGMCLFEAWRRKAPTASNTELDVKVLSDCDVLLRSSHTKDSGIKREMSLSMRVLSVVPRYAVAVGSLKQNAEGERR